MTEFEARQALVSAGQRLMAEGLVARSWGNLSVRLDAQTMAVTPSGILWSDLVPEMISVVDLATGEWKGGWKPSGERKVHREIYRRRPEVNAVVHTHQSAASVCAVARVGVRLGTEVVPCAPYGLPGTKRLTLGTVGALAGGPAVLMANHGVFTVGRDLDQAFDRIRDLEVACAAHITAHAPHPLPDRVDSPWDPSWLAAVEDQPQLWKSRAPFTLAWSKRREPLLAVLDDLAQLAGPRVASVAALPGRRPSTDVVLVQDEGAFVWGNDAEALAMVVEKAARAALGAQGLGGAHRFPAWEAHLMRLVYKNAYSKQARLTSRPATP